MAAQTPDQIFSALDNCLEQEKVALLDGDLEGISALMEEKSALISELNAFGAIQQPRLDLLREKAQRNQVLFDGALDGIRRVSDRLAELHALRHSFDTYDSHGQRCRIEGSTTRKVEKRS